MPGSDDVAELEAVLSESWEIALRLPDDDPSFDRLTPEQRRRAHDLGVKVQDRLTRTLSRLVLGMAHDGADLVDKDGLAPGLGPTESAENS